MAFSTVNALGQIRDLVAAVTGMTRVYAPSETNDDKIPEALDKFPAAVILDGPITEYKLMGGMHSKTYDVRIQLFSGNGDTGDQAATILPYVDAIIEKFVGNVRLGARVAMCEFRRSSGSIGLEYPPGGGIFYSGHELTLEVIETAAATAAVGA